MRSAIGLKIILVMVFFFLAFAVSSQSKPMIAVLPFGSIEVPEHVSKIISQLFETHLVNTKAYEVLSQNERDQILSAQAMSLSGCSDEACAIELGKILSAEQVIIGTVASLGTKYIINAKIIDVTTSKTLAADMISADSVEGLDTACRSLAGSLVSKALPGTAEQIAAAQPPAIKEPAPSKEPRERKPLFVRPERVPRESSGDTDIIPVIALFSGSVITSSGTFFNSLAQGAAYKTGLAWEDYVGAFDGSGNLYDGDSPGTYTDFYNAYLGWSYGSYGAFALGLAGYAAAPFTGGIYLSIPGKITASAGYLLRFIGNISGAVSINALWAADTAMAEYLSAQGGADTLYGIYSERHSQYLSSRYGSFALWAAGTAAETASLFLPGVKDSVLVTPLSKGLFILGAALGQGGTLLSAMAANSQNSLRDKYAEYLSASGGADMLYNEYLEEVKAYQSFSYAAYGLWGCSALLMAGALFLPPGTEASELPGTVLSNFFIIPTQAGFSVSGSIKF